MMLVTSLNQFIAKVFISLYMAEVFHPFFSCGIKSKTYQAYSLSLYQHAEEEIKCVFDDI